MKRTDDQKRDKLSFRQILDGVASQNARQLMGRARLANKLAKSLGGQSRARAYAVKTRALLGLTTQFPERVKIITDFRTPRYVLVKSLRTRFGLHAPEIQFRR